MINLISIFIYLSVYFFINLFIHLLCQSAIYYIILSCIEYGTDKEWSRYLTLIAFFWILLIGFAVADLFYVKFKVFFTFILFKTNTNLELFKFI